MYPLDPLLSNLQQLHAAYADYRGSTITLADVIECQTNTTTHMYGLGYMADTTAQQQLMPFDIDQLIKLCQRKSRYIAGLLHWMLKMGINSQAVANAIPHEAAKNRVYVTSSTTPIEFLFALYAQLHSLMCGVYRQYMRQLLPQ